jgi:hypothetical protein
MSNGDITIAPNSVNPNTLRVRRYRERRREGVRCLTVEMYEADIAESTARGLLKSDGDAWNVLDAWYACHLVRYGAEMAGRQQSNQTRTARRRGLNPSQYQHLVGGG